MQSLPCPSCGTAYLLVGSSDSKTKFVGQNVMSYVDKKSLNFNGKSAWWRAIGFLLAYISMGKVWKCKISTAIYQFCNLSVFDSQWGSLEIILKASRLKEHCTSHYICMCRFIYFCTTQETFIQSEHLIPFPGQKYTYLHRHANVCIRSEPKRFGVNCINTANTLPLLYLLWVSICTHIVYAIIRPLETARVQHCRVRMEIFSFIHAMWDFCVWIISGTVLKKNLFKEMSIWKQHFKYKVHRLIAKHSNRGKTVQ